MLDEYWGPCEADYLHHYGRDLADDLVNEPLRKVSSLLAELPRGGALGRAADPEWSWWTADHEYLSAVVEVVDASSRRISQVVASSVGAKKPLDFGDPLRLPRPSDMPEVASSKDDVRNFFGGAR